MCMHAYMWCVREGCGNEDVLLSVGRGSQCGCGFHCCGQEAETGEARNA